VSSIATTAITRSLSIVLRLATVEGDASQNWRGKPLLSRQLIVQLIAATRTATGLTISCAIDAGRCPKGAKIPDAQRAAINAKYDAFHPDWNYTTTSSKSAFDFKILKHLFRHGPLGEDDFSHFSGGLPQNRSSPIPSQSPN